MGSNPSQASGDGLQVSFGLGHHYTEANKLVPNAFV